ncbi:MAG: 5-(carboxyamino)imidazole ribonucleotide mutase [Deltaproteobacteria bacterium]|nr:5-(carboxyamino)imidazole ribonucleotide mutase [Deltaproteobacteria bacterium]
MPAKKPLVGILMGSDSDMDVMEDAAKILKSFDIPFEMTISSAHRTPERTSRYAKGAEKRGIKVIIAGAGSAAHLAGFIAAETTLPVIGVPIDSSPLKGLDALLSTVQMPGGIPVAAMAVGKAGAKNAGVFAVEILSLTDAKLKGALKEYRKRLARQVEEKAEKLKGRS